MPVVFLTREFFHNEVSIMNSSSPPDPASGSVTDSASRKGERSKPSAKKPSSFYMKQMRAGLGAASRSTSWPRQVPLPLSGVSRPHSTSTMAASPLPL